ncbi:hypothetical protein PMAYCL1PPCAC_22177, partial [Pristionchus mayeri]
ALTMRLFATVFYFVSLITISESVTCVKWKMYKVDELDTCTGDVCLSFIYGGSVRIMGCGTNVNFSNRTGCFGYTQAVEGMLCA